MVGDCYALDMSIVLVLDVGSKGVGGHKVIIGMVWKGPKAGECLRVFEGVDMVLYLGVMVIGGEEMIVKVL